MKLVIVESPTKAKTIGRFLGDEFVVKSSFGHIRDLPKRELGVDVDNNFTPKYVVPLASKKVATDLAKSASKADEIYFATDEDREGEAISWHLSEVLKTEPKKIKRITFHEITKEAISESLLHPRKIDLNMVSAQQARRVLDRLVGYELSPFLWKKVAKGLSAGRVQSVAVRLIVEREREIQKFIPEEYWSLEAVFELPATKETFPARLHKADGAILEKLAVKNADEAKKILKNLENTDYTIASVEKKEIRRSPPAPFITSTLQQEANRKLNFSAKQTMMIAQQLYEGTDLMGEGQVGLITYMRTDSVNLSEKFLNEAAAFIKKEFGGDYAPSSPRRHLNKSKLAQEAHEAIRPTEVARTPQKVRDYLTDQQYKLYDLIWKRAVASQMNEAVLSSTSVDVETDGAKPKYVFRATGQMIAFDGYMRIYPDAQKESALPPSLEAGTPARAAGIEPKQHFTEPPARYSDASLVHALEEYGIGRPSTYAPTISTVIDRGYVERIENRRLKPTEIAFLVNDLLVRHFPQIVDYGFTAKMEDSLDEIAEGEREWVPAVREFYEPFKKNLTKKEKEISKRALTEEASDQICEKCGAPMVVKMGRFGKFLACTGFPACRQTKPLPKSGDENQNKTPLPKPTAPCEKCGAPLEAKEGRFGAYFRCTKHPECDYTKSISLNTGVKCPSCKTGDLVERRTKRKRIFYGCDKYPKCTFALWNKPTGEECPSCGSLLVLGAKGVIRCSQKECDYSREGNKQ
ncbi:type I DNA topoisomerase [Candidatus Uhrbacteria bacterium]|nr:type I DNA topoisomerase [Candidatus Uhrbacteria bacterium]